MLSLVISCPLLPGFSTKEAPFGCSCRHKKSPNHHQPEHKTYFHFSSHIFVSYYVSYVSCWDFNDVTLAFEDINLVFDTDDGVWGVDVVVESCKCFSCLMSISISCLSMSILMLNLKSLKRACGQARTRSWCLYWCQGRVWSWCWCWCRYWVLVKILKRMFCEDFETNFCLNLRSWFGQLWHSLGLFCLWPFFCSLRKKNKCA